MTFDRIKGIAYSMMVFLLVFTVILVQAVYAADLVAVSSFGYHPNSSKQVIVYTNSSTIYTTADLKEAGTGNIVYTISFAKPKDYDGNDVECQGNMPCYVGNFSNFYLAGEYYIEVSGIKSPIFRINKDIFVDNIPIFDEFFNAMLQQNSDYHEDLHDDYEPEFPAMADGSFIMEADQAALTLIRLGSAYRRNPSFFVFDKYDIINSNVPDMQEYILTYANYLQGLQGLVVEERSDGIGFRLNPSVEVINAFVPGPTNLTNLTVYIPGNPSQILKTVNVTSLCGSDDGSAEWPKCIADAAFYYKCQIDEPCLNLSYIQKTGKVKSTDNGYAVSRGWGYEFGCYFDVDLEDDLFDDKPNPCMIFYPESERKYDVRALLAFLEALPAVNDYSSPEGLELLERAKKTYDNIKTIDSAFSSNDGDVGFFGASLFLLFNYTNNASYLQEAHSLRDKVNTSLISDHTRGEEFYWEEYVMNKNAITNAALEYQYNSQDPAELFRGKIFYDYKDLGTVSMSKNGERVYQFDPNIQFQNSRYILLEGLFASKTMELHSSPELFISEVADHQLAWLTGMNAVQNGTAIDSPTISLSFIFGIGNFPNEFHSRYLYDSGYSAASGDKIIGARGTSLQFFDESNNEYVFLDGMHTILGKNFGSSGNGWRNETKNSGFRTGTTFKNGLTYIPGWINGPFDTVSDQDVIFNYKDDLSTYEFTESTNEIVATAIEFLAYLDGRRNNKQRHNGIYKNISTTVQNGTILVNITPPQSDVYLNSILQGTTDLSGTLLIENVVPGNHTLIANKSGYLINQTKILLLEGQNLSLFINLIKIIQNGSLVINATPIFVDVYLNNKFAGATNESGQLSIQNLSPENYSLIINKTNYIPYESTVDIGEGTATLLNIQLILNNTVIISAAETNLATAVNSTNGADHYMFEVDNATFFVKLNLNDTILWYVNGVLAQSSNSINSTFVWSPGILWTPISPNNYNIRPVNITATAGNQSKKFIVDVEDTINPFFSSLDGSIDIVNAPDTQIHVFTNAKRINFTNVNVTVKNIDSGIVVIYSLGPFKNNNSDETDWKHSIFNIEYGNNYLKKIVGFNNNTNLTEIYELGTERGHYRSFPAPPSESSSSSSSSSSKSGGGGGGGGAPIAPEVIYSTLKHDVITLSEQQTITLDAKYLLNGISKVEAVFLPPYGPTIFVQLSLVNGKSSYGTWSANFSGFNPGLYKLYSITLWTNDTTPVSKEINILDRSFYVVSDVVAKDEMLGLVYSILNESSIKNGSTVLLTLDARDKEGLVSVLATVSTSKGDSMIAPLKLTAGSKQYGTWKGVFVTTQPDTTYSVTEITLSNGKESKTYPIKDRSVYVAPLPKKSLNAITSNVAASATTFSKEWTDNIIKKPLLPTLIGFGLMSIALTLVFLGPNILNHVKNLREGKR